MSNLRPVLLLLIVWCGSAFAGASPAITFSPVNPIAGDTIIATLSMPTCGGMTTMVVAARQITLTTVEGGCGVPPPTTMATLGPLGAGTYQVQWLIAPSQTPVATAILIVAPTLTFFPAHPTAGDTVVALLGMQTCGINTVVVGATQISITTTTAAGGICLGVLPPVTEAILGPLAAGTYQVQWLIAPGQTPVATATLIVAAAVNTAPAPALTPWAMLLLVLVIAAFAARHLRNGDSEAER
jgi:hypothetical protein